MKSSTAPGPSRGGTQPAINSARPAAQGSSKHAADEKKKKPPPPKTEPKYFVHSRRFLDGIVIFFAVCTLLLTRWLRPGFWSTIMYALVGLPIGLALSFLFYGRQKSKLKSRQLFNIEPGAKGLEELVQRVPTWVTLSHSEKCEWINDMLEEMWPFYDLAVCSMVREMMEPIFESIKPPGITTLTFAKLQFGDAPMRIEAIRMDRERTDGVYLEMDIRWAGEPEIKLKVGLPGAPTLQPKVSNIRMVATAGIHLKPLVDEIPAFGAVVVTLTKPPKLNYAIDTGGGPVGKVVGGGVEAFLSTLLPDILNGFLVWPQRIVVPILPEEVTGPLTDLQLRQKGILKVEVLEARDIPRMDKMGSSDPSVDLFTDPKRKLTTKTKKNTLNPKWDDETHFLMVQEPESQFMRFEMHDIDMVNAKQLLKLNIVKGATNVFGAKESMGKGQVDLRAVCVSKPGEAITQWFPLGAEDWSNDDGPGRDRGELKLTVTYVPLTRSNPMVGDYGAVFVYVRKGRDFPRMIADAEDSCNPYFSAKIGDQTETAQPVKNTCDPDWGNAVLSFYNVPNTQEIRIKFKNKSGGLGGIGTDEDLGYVNIEIDAVRRDKFRHQRGCSYKEYELQDADSGYATVEVQYVAYF